MATAERKASAALQQARVEARELADRLKQSAHDKAETLVQDAAKHAEAQRQRLLAEVATQQEGSGVDAAIRDQAVSLILHTVAFPDAGN